VNVIFIKLSIKKVSSKTAFEKQMIQRQKFRLITGWLRPLLKLINIGYQFLSAEQTLMNLAVGYHMKEALIGTGADAQIDFKKAIFSRVALKRFTDTLGNLSIVHNARFGILFFNV